MQNQDQTKLPNISVNKPKSIPRKSGYLDRTRSKTQYSDASSQKSYNNTGQSFNKRIPFKIPVENEVFDYQEEQKRKRHAEKVLAQNQRIWEKTTKNTQMPLKQPKNFEVQLNQNHQTKLQYNQKQKKSINSALEIIKQRSLTRDQPQQKLVVNQVIEQKKEMFLVTMTHGIVEKEIEKLQKITNEKEMALELSKNMLKADEEEFNRYLEKNKKDRAHAEKLEDNAVKERQQKEREIKSLNQQIMVLKHQIDRLNEDIHNYLQNKNFLDKLASKEFLNEREQNIQMKINQLEPDWIQENLIGEKQFQFWKNQCTSKNLRDLESAGSITFLQKQKIYRELVDLQKIEEIVQYIDEYKEPFTKTDELKKVFDRLEQKNLFKMQEFQQLQQEFEEQVYQYKLLQQTMEPKVQNLKDQKENMKREIDKLNEEIQVIKMKQHINLDSSNDFKVIQKIILKQLFDTEDNVFNIQDPQSLDPKTILTHIELLLEQYIKNFNKYDPKLVEKHRHKADVKRKENTRLVIGQRIEQEQKEKFQKNLEKVLKPIQKRTGRISMTKSLADKKIKKKVEKVDTNIDETDKYLDPNFQFN